MNIPVSKGTALRLERIKEIKGYTLEEALEYAISVAWLAAEKYPTRPPGQVKIVVPPKRKCKCTDGDARE